MSLYQVMEKENIDSKFNQGGFQRSSFSKSAKEWPIVGGFWLPDHFLGRNSNVSISRVSFN